MMLQTPHDGMKPRTVGVEESSPKRGVTIWPSANSGRTSSRAEEPDTAWISFSMSVGNHAKVSLIKCSIGPHRARAGGAGEA